MCYVTEQGREDIRKTRDYHRKRFLDLRRQLGDTTVKVPQPGSGGGSTDNDQITILLEAEREEQLFLQSEELLRRAVAVAPPADNSVADIGTLVTILRLNENFDAVGTETYLIGGYESTDMKTRPWPTIGYNAPIIRPIFRKSVDPDRDPAEVHLNGRVVGIELLRIELPGAIVPLREAS